MKNRNNQRGFALLIVVLLVALVSVAGAALLDIVHVDLFISGMHRKAVDAESNAMGAAIEMLEDGERSSFEPGYTEPDLKHRYAARVAGNIIRDPDSVTLTGPTPLNSPFVANVGTGIEDSYTSDVRLIRLGTPLNTGLTVTPHSVVYEVRIETVASGGDATREVRVVTEGRPITVGQHVPLKHAR